MRYLEMHGQPGDNSTRSPQQLRTGKSAMCKVGNLIRQLSDDEDDDDIDASTHALDEAPWCKDFHRYLNSKDQLGNMSIVEWWGVHIIFIFSLLLESN
jgi:hypothetical protein